MPECEHCGVDSANVKEWMGMWLCEGCYTLFDVEVDPLVGDDLDGSTYESKEVRK